MNLVEAALFLIQLLLPASNDRKDDAAFSKTKDELVERFGGVTAYTHSPAQGVWISPDGGKARDSMLMVEVLAEELDTPWWRSYKTTLAARFAEKEIHVRALHADMP